MLKYIFFWIFTSNYFLYPPPPSPFTTSFTVNMSLVSGVINEEKSFDQLFSENPAWNANPITRITFETCLKACLLAQDGIDAMERSMGRSVPSRRQRLAEVMAALDPSRSFVLPSDSSPASPASAASAASPASASVRKIEETNKKKKRKTQLELLEVWGSVQVSGKRARKTSPYSS